MWRRDIFRAGAAIGITDVSRCTSQRGRVNVTDGFEDDIGTWEPHATIGPEVDIEDFAVGTTVIWEADATHYVDDLAVAIESR